MLICYLMLQNSLLSRGDPLLNLASHVAQQKTPTPAHTGTAYESHLASQPHTPRKAHDSSYFGSPYSVQYSSPSAAPDFLPTPNRRGQLADQPSTPLRAAAVADGGPPSSRRRLGLVGVASPLAATPQSQPSAPGFDVQTASLNRLGDALPASPMSAGCYRTDRGDVLATPRSGRYAAADSTYQPITPSCIDYQVGSPVGNVTCVRNL